MIQTIFSALAVYVSTSIDYLFYFDDYFFSSPYEKDFYHIYWGQYLGTGILVVVSLFIAYVLNYIPQDWVIGLLGLIPIYLGIRLAIKGEEEEDEGEVIEKVSSGKSNRLFWSVALITIASGGDNLGIYIPYFTSLSISEIITVLVIFAISISVICYISYKLAKISFVADTLDKYKRIIVPVVFVGLGIFIMLENGTFEAFLNTFN